MTELPDLPPPPDRYRAVPPGGLEKAMTVGTGRRRRFLGGAAGGTLAVVLGSTLLLGGGPASDALVANNPEPPASASPAPSGMPTAQVSPVPIPTGSTGPGSGTDPGPGTSAEPEPEPSEPPPTVEAGPADPGQPGAVPVRDERDDYVEDPADTAAPVNCAQPPDGQFGPVFTGGASACGYASGGGSVRQGGQARVVLGACQSRGGRSVTFGYAGGQEHDVVVTRDGREVFRFSPTVRYTQGAHERTIAAGRCLAWSGVWQTELQDGSPAPAGRYEMSVVTTIATVDGEQLAEEFQGQATASVDVVD